MIIDGKYHKVYTVDEDTLCYHRTVDEDDLGKTYVIIQGCIYFVSTPDDNETEENEES